MNKQRIHSIIALSFVVSFFITLIQPLIATAEPRNDFDAATIYCTQEGKDTSDAAVEDCIKNWDGKKSDEIVCNKLYPHDQTRSDAKREAFRSCLEGYRDGDAHCVSDRSIGNMKLKDVLVLSQNDIENIAKACLTGANSQVVTQGAAPLPTAEEPTQLLGPAPQSASMNAMHAPGSNKKETIAGCSISGFMGDILCGGAEIMGQMADASLNILGAFMKVPPLHTSADNPIFIYWNVFRHIANIAFILVFIVVIYSYITGAGLNNYSVKRILPRLIAAAILVNVSFYVCSILVDISNILGATIYSTVSDLVSLTGVAGQSDPLQENIAPVTNSLTANMSWAMLVSQAMLVVPGTAALVSWGGFAALLPVLLSVLIAVVTTVIVLLLRQVLIILFIVISPLAFVSIVLPNTKEYFDRWSRIFIPMLMLYPVVTLLFAAGTIASSILAHSVQGTGYPEKLFFIIMALGMQIIPLFMVPKVLQMGNGMLASFAGASKAKTSRLQKGASDYSKKKRQEGDMKALANPTRFNVGRRKRAQRTLRNQTLKKALSKAETSYEQEKSTDAARKSAQKDLSSTKPSLENTPENLTDGPNKPMSTSPQASSYNPADKPANEATDTLIARQKVRAHADRVNAVIKQMDSQGVSRADKLDAAFGTDETKAQAAIKDLVERGDDGAAIEIVKSSSKLSSESRDQLVKSLEDGKLAEHPLFNDQEARDNIRMGTVTKETFHEKIVAPAINHHDFSPAQQATMSADALQEFHAGLQKDAKKPEEQRAVHTQAARDFIENASSIPATPKLYDKIGNQAPMIKSLTDMHNKGDFR